ncbi:hypothetical protein BX616_004260 [Lobosporangium transversale]|uniref:HotDog domain-containing protein n=1 Tax=Lobosporangium transversale TaxID=64571 RepID=A0A1Y2GJN5_9FUNG|nr:HotDog domain-containing protein [Lobosporangium transversale]KAF9898273.1 hypothetical protein BX616_004260 [Lobosporangium transversale]ORZ12939.1 HotDog domain-containing protein [Lobosporangium transversale]|eukprot:XP_021880288.1 HotDog domain-containing protein [Lobosporangium transversale]
MNPIHRLAQVFAHLRAQAFATTSASSPMSRMVSVSTSTSSLYRNYTSSSSSPTSNKGAADSTTTAATTPKAHKVTKKDRAFYPYSLDIQSRWADNDQYGHLNNTYYYALFDTVINTFLIQEAGLDPHNQSQGTAIGVAAESGCQYFDSLSFPDMIEARLAVIKLGRSSVVYQVGIFKKLSLTQRQQQQQEGGGEAGAGGNTVTRGASPSSAGVFSRAATSVLDPVKEADIDKVFHPNQLQGDVAAAGHFCHVFVDKNSRRPVPIPERIRAGLERLQVTP